MITAAKLLNMQRSKNHKETMDGEVNEVGRYDKIDCFSFF